MVSDSNEEINFLQKLLLANKQVSKICNAFTNGPSANVKFSRTQLCKMVTLREFLGKLLGPLLKTGLPFMKNVLNPLAKIAKLFLIPLKLTAAASTTNVANKKIFGTDVHSGMLAMCPSDLAK